MTSQPKPFKASGMLYPNPRYGQEGEPPLRGTVFCRGSQDRQVVRYEVSAWYRFPDCRSDYILQIGDSMPGVMCRWWDEDHVAPGLDMEGTAGVDHEYIVEARYVDLERTIISIEIYSGETEAVTSNCGPTPQFI